ncbi:MAG: TIGR03936 family radical SAM-associated protein [Dethiobacteria bacterium]
MQYRLKFSFTREENIKYISHLDMMRLLQRALRRAEIPVAYSGGFNPQPRLSIALPLPLGVTAEHELAEIYLEESFSPSLFTDRMREKLPRGLSLIGAEEISDKERSLMQMIDAALYLAFPLPGGGSLPEGILSGGVEEVKGRTELIVQRMGKKGPRKIDIRPYIIELEMIKEGNGTEIIRMFLQAGSRGGARPGELLGILGAAGGLETLPYLLQIHRRGLFHNRRGHWEQIV